MTKHNDILVHERISKAIYLIRNQKVMLDSELANLYGVETRVLNQAVKRNAERFPEDFMFRLSPEEWDQLKSGLADTAQEEALRSQSVTLEKGRGKHRKYMPLVFTEQGIAMLSSVLNSPSAIQVNISIMRVFVKMRQWAAHYEDLARKIDELSQTQGEHNDHIRNIYQIIEELVRPAITERKPIGFKKD
jgi:hypothetical protein